MAALISHSLSLSLFFILYVINFIRKKWSQVHREYSSWTSVILSLIWYARVFGFMYFHMLFNSPCTLPAYYGCVVLIYLNKFDFYWLKKKKKKKKHYWNRFLPTDISTGMTSYELWELLAFYQLNPVPAMLLSPICLRNCMIRPPC